MIDSIGSSTSLVSSRRTQALTQTNNLARPDVLTAIQQSEQRQSGASSAVPVFAVAQAAKSGNAATAKLPRGSLVDLMV